MSTSKRLFRPQLRNARVGTKTGQPSEDIEERKLVLERDKYLLEKAKVKWTALSVAVPLTVAAGTIALGVWGQYEKAKADFELKAAEVIMATDNPIVTYNKAETLARIFPHRLPANLAERFNPDSFPPDNSAAQKELLQLVIAKPHSAPETIRAWKAMYPGDTWVNDFEANLWKRPPTSEQGPREKTGPLKR